MPSGFETYTLYLAIKNHFTRPSYDFHKYNGKVSAKFTSFEKRRDRYFFEKLGKKFPREKLVDLFVANFIKNPNIWIGDLLDGQAEENYTEWQKIVESLSYRVTEDFNGMLTWLEKREKKFNDLFRVDGADHPIVVKMALQEVIHLETFIILDAVLGFGKRIAKKLDDPIWQDFYMKATKYRPFINIDVEKFRKELKISIEIWHPDVV